MKKILIALSVVSLLGLSVSCNRQESGSSQEQTERSPTDSSMDATGSGPAAGGTEMQGTESDMGSDAQQMEESGSDMGSDTQMMEDQSGSGVDTQNP